MPGDAARSTQPAPTTAEVDLLLTAQIAVAWAGEGHVGEEPRLGWWRSDLTSEFGGRDLFERLLPRTYRWAVFQAVREAARRTDAEMRERANNPDAARPAGGRPGARSGRCCARSRGGGLPRTWPGSARAGGYRSPRGISTARWGLAASRWPS